MKLSVFSAVLCAFSLSSVLGSCTCGSNNGTGPACCNNYNYCKSICPEYTGISILVATIFGSSKPFYTYYSIDKGELTFVTLNNIDRDNGRLTFIALLIIIYKYGNNYYYLEINGVAKGGCAVSRELTYSRAAVSTTVLTAQYKALEIVKKLAQPYYGPCTVLRDTNQPLPEGVQGYYQLESNRYASVESCEDKTMSNNNYSVTQQTINQYALQNRVQTGSSSTDNGSPDRCQYFIDSDSSCGTPTYCAQLYNAPGYRTVIERIPGCYLKCVTPGNRDAARAFAECFCPGTSFYPFGPFIRTDWMFVSPDSNVDYIRSAGYFTSGVVKSGLTYVCDLH